MAKFWDVYGASAQVPCVMDKIPGPLHADILLGISTVDVSSYINQALAEYGMIRLPLVGQLSVGTSIVVPSGGAIYGNNFQCTIKALPNFGDIPVIRNARVNPPQNELRDRNITLTGFRVDGNLDNNFTATQFGHGVKLYAVDGCQIDLQAVNCKGDGLTIQYSESYEFLGSANVVGRIRTSRCDRQGVAMICGEQINLDIVDEASRLCSLCIEPDDPENFIRNCVFRVQSFRTGDGSDVSGGFVCAGDGLGCRPTNVMIDFEVFEPAGYGGMWRDAVNLTLRGSVHNPGRGGIIGLSGGIGPSTVFFDGVRVVGGTNSGFAAREIVGSVYDGSIFVENSGGMGAQFENVRGGVLQLRVEGNQDHGVYISNCRDMTFTNLVARRNRMNNVTLINASTGNRFPGMRSTESQLGWGLYEYPGCNDNKATQARMSGNAAGSVTVTGAGSYVMPEA